ncbi:MAG TPA: uracil-DNA glycosylase [Burkholderiaceae bacterium]|jgi:DNA polymerase
MTSTANRREIFLAEMGIGPVWQRRDASENLPGLDQKIPLKSESEILPVSSASPNADDVATMDWAQLRAVVAGCTKCDLCHGRTQTVFGTGDVKAKWLFVGEGPGRNEDLQGEPFVGPAGKLLDNMLLAMGLKRGINTYIANIVKCRPTGADGRDRPPTPEESAACMPYLERQIALIQPTVIVALGKTAAVSLLGVDANASVAQLRGKVHRFADLPLVVTYHPAYLLRKLEDKSKTWRDLCLAMSTYAARSQSTD